MEYGRDLEELIEMQGRMRIALDLLESCREFSSLVPEVRTNLVFARNRAESPGDVLAVDGRITVIDGMPRAAGGVKFGASNHMARLVLELRRREPVPRAGINFANTPSLTAWMEDYARARDWVFGVIDRKNEPEELKGEEGASMPWKVAEAVRSTGGLVPDLLYETGAMGKEPVTVLVGREPISVVTAVIELAKAWQGAPGR